METRHVGLTRDYEEAGRSKAGLTTVGLEMGDLKADRVTGHVAGREMGYRCFGRCRFRESRGEAPLARPLSTGNEWGR
ncbi:hypothetical protein SLA2020_421730 [Shorea laevis]